MLLFADERPLSVLQAWRGGGSGKGSRRSERERSCRGSLTLLNPFPRELQENGYVAVCTGWRCRPAAESTFRRRARRKVGGLREPAGAQSGLWVPWTFIRPFMSVPARFRCYYRNWRRDWPRGSSGWELVIQHSEGTTARTTKTLHYITFS